MFKEDYIERHMQLIAISLAKTIFNKEQIVHELTDPYRNADTNELHKRLMDLLADGKINEAENLLFEAIEINSTFDYDYVRIALDFYLKLDQYNDNYLELCQFSRKEIETGWNEITKLF